MSRGHFLRQISWTSAAQWVSAPGRWQSGTLRQTSQGWTCLHIFWQLLNYTRGIHSASMEKLRALWPLSAQLSIERLLMPNRS